ncbi:MAG TPA: hypothetical protein VK964_01305 [Nocardioidaceae bacterium]|nr:hypothetical protein [Nocardioidaceae bacterium]
MDPARVGHPKDKARVERTVAYVRGSFFGGEDFADLADAQRHAEVWCATLAGQRVHGTTQRRPGELFAAEEAARLLPAPAMPYDLLVYAQPKVARDHHVEVANALYSVPGHLIGRRIEARADAQLVKLFWRSALIKVHPRQPAGGRSTDPADLPERRARYALRDIGYLCRQADTHGVSVGIYARRLLDVDLPWTRMRQGLPAVGPRPPLRRRTLRHRVRSCPRPGCRRCRVDRPHPRTRPRTRPAAQPPVAPQLPLRFARHQGSVR